MQAVRRRPKLRFLQYVRGCAEICTAICVVPAQHDQNYTAHCTARAQIDCWRTIITVIDAPGLFRVLYLYTCIRLAIFVSQY